MESRLQNIEPVDIHGFQFDGSSSFDAGYSAPVYAHGLNDTQSVHPHAQSHYVQDGSVYYDPALQQPQPQPAQPTQRQPRRAAVAAKSQQRGRLQGINANGNTAANSNIDPTLNNTSTSTTTNSNGGGSGAVQSRKTRQSQHPIRSGQQGRSQPTSQQSQPQHAHYMNTFSSDLQHSPTIAQASATSRASSSGPLATPKAGSRSLNANLADNTRRSSGQQIQQTPNIQTPSSVAPSVDASLGYALSTPNSHNTPLPDHLTAFNPPSTFNFVADPPNLQDWRERFFNITEPILLTSEQYHTYFPHVDNIYSHRSTQKYKKKPFVSHYWDCRLKGRPTGQPMPKLKKAAAAAAKKKGGALDNDVANGERNDGDDDDQAEVNDDNQDQYENKEKKKRKRKVRERDLCDVKIKVTEFFGRDELEALGRLGLAEDDNDPSSIGIGSDAVSAAAAASRMVASGSGGGLPAAATAAAAGATNTGQLTFVLEDGTTTTNPALAANGSTMTLMGAMRPESGAAANHNANIPFGVLEPLQRFPEGHPGAEGKRWYMVQRVNGSGKDGEALEGVDLDHKHTLEESDRIKKNSVQRWMMAQEKEKKKQAQRAKNPASSSQSEQSPATRTLSGPSFASYFASGDARATVKAHASPASTGIVLYGSAYCPFAQRVWIALELKGIPYQFIELTPHNVKDGKCVSPGLLEVNPGGHVPTIRHGNWGVWESSVMMEYLEDLSIGHSLLPLGNPQLRAHCRLWADHINRKILPYFYALLLLPTIDNEDELALHNFMYDASGNGAHTRTELINRLQAAITDLVNASHATGPYFLGSDISFVDVVFAPWIIRLSRVISYYRDFPRPEVGTRWSNWVNAIEANDYVKRTVSDERAYHYVYQSFNATGFDANATSVQPKCIEWVYAQTVLRVLGFGFGDDTFERLRKDTSIVRKVQ